MSQTITIQQALQTKNAVFIDTRTPKEFQEDHLPKAINLPILSNEERAIVGTLYKQVSQEQALEQGQQYWEQKVPYFLKEIQKYQDKTIIVNCWRGGMRSKVVVSLLTANGYQALQLIGGYKEYRRYVREQLTNFRLKPKLIVLWGLTCTGKTALLQQFQNSLDLEGLAQHRGSLYGGINLVPHSQKRFESLLLQRLHQLNDQRFIIIEGESRKIGDVQIPDFLYKAMVHGKHFLITRSMECRAEEAVKEYCKAENIEEIKRITLKLDKVINKKNKEAIIAFLEKKQYSEAMKLLLQHYYDPLYQHTLSKFTFVGEINNDDIFVARQNFEKMVKKSI